MTKKKKRPDLPRLSSEYSDALDKVDLNMLQTYINTGDYKGFPDELVLYLELLEIIRSMYSKYEDKQAIIRTLMMPVYNLERRKANRIYYDALNFFYADNQVKQKAWANIYADHMDRLAYYAIERDEIENARRCFKDAAEFRGVGREDRTGIPEEMKQRPLIIYTMDPEKVGLPAVSRKELGEFIDKLPEISERDRVRIKREGGVEDVKLFEDIVDEEDKG